MASCDLGCAFVQAFALSSAEVPERAAKATSTERLYRAGSPLLRAASKIMEKPALGSPWAICISPSRINISHSALKLEFSVAAEFGCLGKGDDCAQAELNELVEMTKLAAPVSKAPRSVYVGD